MDLNMTEEKRIEYLKSWSGSRTLADQKLQDYEFLSTALTLNDYQFKRVFMNDRQQGMTWSAYMKVMLAVKNDEIHKITTTTFDDDGNQKLDRLHNFKEFIENNYPYFDISSLCAFSFVMHFNKEKYAKIHPDKCV